MKLAREFYTRDDAITVSRELLGKLLVVPTADGRRVSGMIVETEAYLGTIDKAAHSYGSRRTARNEVTYAEGGLVYVFFIYGLYHQLNVVTGPSDVPHVTLIRALEPVDGIEIMDQRRGSKRGRELTSGPGKLCMAMDIDRRFNGEDLLADKIWIEEYKSVGSEKILTGPRIGIDYAEEFAGVPWRFWIRNNDFVSKK